MVEQIELLDFCRSLRYKQTFGRRCTVLFRMMFFSSRKTISCDFWLPGYQWQLQNILTKTFPVETSNLFFFYADPLDFSILSSNCSFWTTLPWTIFQGRTHVSFGDSVKIGRIPLESILMKIPFLPKSLGKIFPNSFFWDAYDLSHLPHLYSPVIRQIYATFR